MMENDYGVWYFDVGEQNDQNNFVSFTLHQHASVSRDTFFFERKDEYILSVLPGPRA